MDTFPIEIQARSVKIMTVANQDTPYISTSGMHKPLLHRASESTTKQTLRQRAQEESVATSRVPLFLLSSFSLPFLSCFQLLSLVAVESTEGMDGSERFLYLLAIFGG